MFWNPCSLPAIIGGVLLYYLGNRLSVRIQSLGRRWGVGLLLGLLCLPALSFDLYYAHLIATPWWYIAWRSLPGIECLAACWGLMFGFLGSCLFAMRPRLFCVAGHTCSMVFTLCCLAVPFLKPLVNPLETHGPLRNIWQGAVCLQTCGATCGPASLATIFAYYGRFHSERQIARAAYACSSGTELWYLLRVASRYGLRPCFLHPRYLADIPIPALLGVSAGDDARSGHFITLLGKTGDNYLIGDPLGGKKTLSARQFLSMYGRVHDVVHFSLTP